MPFEGRLGDHGLRKPRELVLIADVERDRLVNVCALRLDLERVQRKPADGVLVPGRVVPRHVKRLAELDRGGEDASV